MPKSTRELTTVYTGLALEDFEKFSSLASAKKMSRSELAREAIRFYLAWQGQTMSWTGTGAIAQLLERLNDSLYENYSPGNATLSKESHSENSFQEDSGTASWHDAGEEMESCLVRSDQLPTALRLENLVEKFEKVALSMGEMTRKEHDLEQAMLPNRLDRLERVLLNLEQYMASSTAAGQVSAAMSAEDLRHFDQKISQVVSRASANIEIGNARIENLQDRFREMEGSLGAQIEQRLAALEKRLSANLDDKMAVLKMPANQNNDVSGVLITLEERIVQAIRKGFDGLQSKAVEMDNNFAELISTAEERITHAVSQAMGSLRPGTETSERGELRELLQSSENRICTLAGSFSELNDSTNLSFARAQSAELENFIRGMLQKIAVEVSLLHFVMWRNQDGDRDQLFAVANVRAAERVKKWLKQVEGDPISVMHEHATNLF